MVGEGGYVKAAMFGEGSEDLLESCQSRSISWTGSPLHTADSSPKWSSMRRVHSPARFLFEYQFCIPECPTERSEYSPWPCLM